MLGAGCPGTPTPTPLPKAGGLLPGSLCPCTGLWVPFLREAEQGRL